MSRPPRPSPTARVHRRRAAAAPTGAAADRTSVGRRGRLDSAGSSGSAAHPPDWDPYGEPTASVGSSHELEPGQAAAARAALRAVVAVVFAGVFVYLLVRREWLAAAIIFPFAATQAYLAVTVARGSDLGHRS